MESSEATAPLALSTPRHEMIATTDPPSPLPLLEEPLLEERHNLQKLKRLGVTEEEMKRWSALKKMGLTDDDFALGARYAAETSILGSDVSKVERLTGYTDVQQKRSKAVKTLGTSEEEISEIRSHVLGQIGRGHVFPGAPSSPERQFPKLKRFSSL
jgi:hypothetical protein